MQIGVESERVRKGERERESERERVCVCVWTTRHRGNQEPLPPLLQGYREAFCQRFSRPTRTDTIRGCSFAITPDDLGRKGTKTKEGIREM